MLSLLSGIGVVLLLFEVGLESRVREMLSVGTSSLLVAKLGVSAQILLGFRVGHLLIPDDGRQVHAFLGVTLCATRVGIIARVLKDLGCGRNHASYNDVPGLVVLAVIAGVIQKGANTSYGR